MTNYQEREDAMMEIFKNHMWSPEFYDIEKHKDWIDSIVKHIDLKSDQPFLQVHVSESIERLSQLFTLAHYAHTLYYKVFLDEITVPHDNLTEQVYQLIIQDLSNRAIYLDAKERLYTVQVIECPIDYRWLKDALAGSFDDTDMCMICRTYDEDDPTVDIYYDLQVNKRFDAEENLEQLIRIQNAELIPIFGETGKYPVGSEVIRDSQAYVTIKPHHGKWNDNNFSKISL